MTLASSRRDFLKRASALSLTGAAGPLMMNLAAFGEAAAAGATDYKALVCVFLYGGNDNANTVIPYDELNHGRYFAERPGIGLKRPDLDTMVLTPKTPLPGGRQYALNPKLSKLRDLFHQEKLAVLLNIGTLVKPTNKDDYVNGTATLPPKLFSHNDQQSFQQSSGSEGNTTGWGGGFGGPFAAENGNPTFTCISVGSPGVFLSGDRTVAYQVATSGAKAITATKEPMYGSQACSDLLKALITESRTHLFEDDFTGIVSRSIDAELALSPALDQSPPSGRFSADNPLSMQLSMVARIIAARTLLNNPPASPKRQVFLVSLGGFDTHDGLADTHPALLQTVADAMSAFQGAMADQGMEKQVTTFTASDFGRTLNSDGDGSDHGWGSMHFVMGGDVLGCNFFGEAPIPANNGDNDVGRGRLLPRMAVDQFAGQLGRWFGVPEADLGNALPNLHNFSTDTLDLNFIKLPTP